MAAKSSDAPPPTERRPKRRKQVLLAGVITYADGAYSFDCTIRDLSETRAIGVVLFGLCVSAAGAQADSYCTYRCMNNGEINGSCVQSCELDRTVVSPNRSGPPRESYGSIYIDSYDAHKYGYSYSFGSRAAAAERAERECRSNASGKGKCNEALWFYNSCGALAVSAEGKWGAQWAYSQRAAAAAAMKTCQSVGGHKCIVQQSFCSR